MANPARSPGGQRVLLGSLENLPAQESRVVRLFLSSTFTDFAVERNHLMQTALPRLRTYCQQHGLALQVVDMRWGVRDDAQNDHQTAELCMREVANCHRLSEGPYFVGFLGNKYGYRPYPNVIEASEYDVIRESALEAERDVSLMDEWFVKDENAVPPVYLLQPITSKFPMYADDAEENADLREQAVKDWEAVNILLTNTFRAAADRAFHKKRISAEQKHRYYISVTEHEFINGILQHEDSKTRTLCFMRDFKNLDMSAAKARRFTDLDGNEVDTEAQELLNDLKINKVETHLSKDYVHKSSVTWQPEGVDSTNLEHRTYLQELEGLFEDGIQKQISASLDTRGGGHNDSDLYKEVLHHSTFCNQKLTSFRGREDLLKDIHHKILDTYTTPVQEQIGDTTKEDENTETSAEQGIEDNESLQESTEENESTKEKIQTGLQDMGVNYSEEDEEEDLSEMIAEQLKMVECEVHSRPLVLHGVSGSGKTALMAKLAQLSDQWLGKNVVKIIRFLGTSSQSASIKQSLLSLCSQIWETYGITKPAHLDLQQDFTTLHMYFTALLTKIDTKDKPLIIFLDSIDQLSNDEGAHGLHWLPRTLPQHVYLIVSMLPDSHDCLVNCRKRLGDEDRFYEIPSLAVTTATDILKAWCSGACRNLTTEQTVAVINKFKEAPQPLFLKLAFEQAMRWKSYTPSSEWILGRTVRAAIEKLFDDVEKRHGKILVTKALGYLTASKSGLGGAEIEDILSCDDEVLQDTYLWHLPPDENIVRLPPLLWRRIHYDLEEYLVERQADNRQIVTWYHRQFFETAADRFVTNDTKTELHDALADYFLGKWATTVKPLELFKRKKGSYPSAFRQVPEQPNCFGRNVFNLRKLNEVPYHLSLSGRYVDFVTVVCRDFDWLESKIHATSIAAVLHDLHFVLEMMEGQDAHPEQTEIKTLYDIFVMCCDVIRKNPDAIASQLIGMLGSGDDLPAGLIILRTKVQEWAAKTRLPVLLPSTQCLPSIGGDIRLVINVAIGHPGDAYELETKCCLSADKRMLYAIDHGSKSGDDLKVYDLQDNAKLVQLHHFKDLDFKSIKFLDETKSFLFEVYTRRDKYDPLWHNIVVDSNYSIMQTVPSGVTFLAINNAGTHAMGIRQAQEGEGGGLVHVIVDITTQQLVKIKYPTDKKPSALAFFTADDSRIILINAATMFIADCRTGEILKDIFPEQKSTWNFGSDMRSLGQFVRTLRMLSDSRMLTPGIGYDGKKKLYLIDLKTGSVIHEMIGHDYAIDLLHVTRDENRVVTATKDTVSASNCGAKRARVWDLRTGKQVCACGIGYSNIFSSLLIAGPEDQYLLTNCRLADPVIQIYFIGTLDNPIETGVPVYELIGHNNEIVFLDNSMDDLFLLSASPDNTVLLWDAAKIFEKCLEVLDETEDLQTLVEEKSRPLERPYRPGEGMMVSTAMAVSTDGKTAMIGTDNGFVILYTTCDLQEVQVQEAAKKKKVMAVLGSSNGRYFISASATVHVWTANTGELVHQLDVGEKTRYGGNDPCCLAEGGNRVVVGYAGMECKGMVYDLETGKLLQKLSGLYGFNCVDITQDGSKVVSTFFDFPMVYSVTDGQTMGFNQSTMDTMMAGCTVLRLSPDGVYVASGSADGSVKVLEVGQERYRFRMQHRSTVVELQFSVDSKKMFTAGFKSILIWSMKDGRLLSSLRCHQAFVTCIRFACQDRFLVTGGMDKKIVIYDLENQVKVTEFHAHCHIRNLAVAADLSSILFAPINIAYLTALKPNDTLARVIQGEHIDVPEVVQKAQAVALAFSTQKAARKTSNFCSVM